MWNANLSINNLQNSRPRTLFKSQSRFGEKVHIPYKKDKGKLRIKKERKKERFNTITFGITIIIAPEAELFAGIPIVKDHSPE